MNEPQLVRLIKEHIAKGDKAAEKSEQHYIAAGQHLKTLKANHGGTWAEWEALLKDRIGIGKSRASELMQIADGRKTVEEVRADTAERVREHEERKKISPLANGGNGADPEASAEAMKAQHAAADEADDDTPKIESKYHPTPAPVQAVLDMVRQLSEEDREEFFGELDEHYSDDLGHRLHEYYDDPWIIRTLVEVIGVDRTRALAKKTPRLILQTIGKVALPDCPWCEGSGHREAEGKHMVPCECTRRRRGEDVAAIKARIERENKEQKIPQQDFSFGLEVRTRDGRVWASGVRLPTEEEVAFYIDCWARSDLRKHGYKKTYEDEDPCDLIAFDIKRHDEQPLMKIHGGKRKTLSFLHGTCGRLEWRPITGGECECKKCKRDRERREADERFAERLNKERESVERALAAGEVSQEQYAEWEDSPVNKSPEWLVRLMRSQPPAAAS
jgi:hypothetical protein